MKYYFVLQVKRIKRKFLEIGIQPIWAYLLLAIAFVFLSKGFFAVVDYAGYLYPLLGLFAIANFSAINRNELINSIYQQKDYYLIRVIENLLLALPFSIYLVYEQQFWMILGLISAAILLAFINFRQQLSFTMPTPFKKMPFEFIIGFRKSLLFILLAYFILFKGIQVDNFNLSLAALIFIFLIAMSFYTKPEHPYFVWIYHLKVNAFLQKKISIAIVCVSLLALPALAILLFFYSEKYLIIGVFLLLAYILLATIIFAKYSAFPREMNLPQAILFALSVSFPPILLIVIPIFYTQAKKRLNPILE